MAFAAAVRKASGMVVQTVGMIVDSHQTEAIVADRHADCVALARGFLDNPRGDRHAAAAPSADVAYLTRHNNCAPAQNIGQAQRWCAINTAGDCGRRLTGPVVCDPAPPITNRQVCS